MGDKGEDFPLQNYYADIYKSYDRVNRIRIDWGDGSVSVIDQPLEAGHHYIISRGQDDLAEITP